ncbi:hypothetical protein CK203_087976 [Vitis vinifera]|uniref:Uncharacterized protein n=1 Tax=Vitis vinifera TaxID=29760 RepID=A0A438D7U9_VITVI|nr:hypothetical protein CK203_087976 [Vitis vinifera]
MATELQPSLMVPAEVAPGETHPPFSYAELEDKLKQIPPGLTMLCLQPRCSRWWNRW